MKLRNVPTRLAAGAFILHSGMEKRDAGAEEAAGAHGMAAGALPAVRDMDPQTFMKNLSLGEMAVGGALLAPFVPRAVAGAALTGFSAGLVALYARTPGMRRPGSVWPTPEGIGLSKDIWLLGIGLGLLVDGLTRDD